MKSITTVFLLLFFFLSVFAGESKLKLVKTIGDERENYTFFNIYSAIESESGDIFIADGRGHFIASYDGQGNFKKRIGQKGQGPGDFFFPGSLNLYNENLFVYDAGNHRFAKIDMNLNIINYFKLNLSAERRFSDNVFVIDKNHFLGSLSILKEGGRSICILNEKGQIEKEIFNKFPIEIENKSKLFENKEFYIGYMSMSRKVISVDRDSRRIFISFKRPDNPIDFFVYDFDGKLKKDFIHMLDKKYIPPQFLLNSQRNYPSQFHACIVESIFIYRQHYLVFIILYEGKKEKFVSSTHNFLLFNQDGELKHEEVLGESFRFFYVSSKGHLLGKSFDSDIEKLYIFKLGI